MSISRTPRRATTTLAIVALSAAVSACSPTLDTRGYLPSAEALSQIRPGEQTRNDIAELLGSPSSVAPFGDSTWLYIQRKTETVAFFEPKTVEQNVVVVEFDDAGVVKDVRRYTAADGKDFTPVSRTTPAPGKELTFLEQLVGNIGRFSSRGDRGGR